MTLESMLRQRLGGSAALEGLLARYDSEPAIFYQQAPGITDSGWNGSRYPQLVFQVYHQGIPERKADGSVVVQIWCQENGPSPETIERILRDALTDLLVVPQSQVPVSISWMRSGPLVDRTQPQLKGAKVQFDVHQLATQTSCDPDPVLALNQWVKEELPELLVLEKGLLPLCYIPDETTPTIYLRTEELKVVEETNAVVWLEGELVGHLFAPPQYRSLGLRQLGGRLMMEGEILLLDGSPLRITDVQIHREADPHTEGQLRLFVTFGLLRRPKYVHKLQIAEINEKED